MTDANTEYWQFRRYMKKGDEPIYSFVEISGEPRGIEDTLFLLKKRFAESIKYDTKEEFLRVQKETLEREAKIRAALESSF